MKDNADSNSDSIGPSPTIVKRASKAQPLEYEIISDKKVNLTKEKAYEFLESETFQGERAVREAHVQFLFDEEMAKRFLWHQVSIACAELDGKTYRINGQHTCWMRLELNDDQKRDVRYIHYKVKDGEQLRALYSAFDRNAPRTQQHVAKVQLLGSDVVDGIPPGYIGSLVTGYRLFSSGGSYGKIARVNMTELITTIKTRHPDLFNIVGRFFVQHYDDAIFVRRSSVVGAMFCTFEKAVKASDEFWGPVCSGISLDSKTDHRWLLRRYIETHSHTIQRGKDVIGQEDLLRASINCWNAWRAGKEISRVGTPKGEDRPKVRA